MKYKLIIDETKDEELIITCHHKREVFDQIEQLITNMDAQLIGYENEDIVILNYDDVVCFVSDNNKVFALVEKHKYLIKKRLYQIEEQLDLNYVRINQSCIANIKQISKFSASFNGFLQVHFKNGYSDYVSRRELKNVKERIGI